MSSEISQGSVGAIAASLTRALEATHRLDERLDDDRKYAGRNIALVHDLRTNIERVNRLLSEMIREIEDGAGLHLISGVYPFRRSDNLRRPTDPTTPGAA